MFYYQFDLLLEETIELSRKGTKKLWRKNFVRNIIGMLLRAQNVGR
jgi:hypothetical protein